MITITSVKSIAKDKLAVYFDQEVTVESDYYGNINNYSITASSGPLGVRKIFIPKNKDFINYVIIATNHQVEEQEYSILIGILRSRLGLWEGPPAYSWVYQRTKTDSTIASFPQMYDVSVSTNLRVLLESISQEDDLIGGIGRGVQIGTSGSGTEGIFAAGGDLFGYYPNPGVDGIQGRYVSAATPVDGDVLTWDAANQWWTPRGGAGVISVINGSGDNVIDGSGNTVIQ